MNNKQVEEQKNYIKEAREFLNQAVKHCPQVVACWRCLAGLEERTNNVAAARSHLEKARVKIPQNPELWIAAIKLELNAGNAKIAEATLAKALQDCPKSGELLALSVEMAPRPQKRAKAMDALQRCDDAHVITAVAKLFWMERRLDKARKWFTRAVTLNPDLGDAWGVFYKFEVQEGTEETRMDVSNKCIAADPHHGEMWTKVSKAIENSNLKTEQILLRVAVL
jgi:pre-mRNA-processing factor 6